MIIQFPFNHFVRSAVDGFFEVLIQFIICMIYGGSGLFKDSISPDKLPGKSFSANFEIFERTLRLCAVVPVGWYFYRTEAVFFNPG